MALMSASNLVRSLFCGAGDASALFPHIQTMKARAASGGSAWPFIGSRNLPYLGEYLSSLASGEPGKKPVSPVPLLDVEESSYRQHSEGITRFKKAQDATTLREQSPHQRCIRYAPYRQAVRPGSHVRPMLPRALVHFRKRAPHHRLQLRVHFRFRPEEALQILHPLKVAHRHAARIRKNVRQQHDSL